MTDPHPDPERYWKHRRRLAYTAMGALLLTLAAALFTPVRPSSVPLLEGLAWVFGVIVIGYYGNNAIESFSRGRK
ncbi:hypothetical protein OZ656_06105 [Marinobacter sp. LM1]|uniref:hypothetical protein n=1 Tax=Marinobacter sp. LM1 TaxID=3003349 RepID=UPI0036D40C4F